MRFLTSYCFVLVALLGLIPHHAFGQERQFEDCATTTFRIANNRLFVAADVFKYTKLRLGQGTMDCLALCRASDECWSFNFDKSKKWCYLISEDGEGLRKKRRQLWSSGYKECVAHSEDTPWDNAPIDPQDLAAELKNIAADFTAGTLAFDWKPAQGTDQLNGAATPKYKVKCGDNDPEWTCDESPIWASSPLTTASELTTNTTDALTKLQERVDGQYAKCYVETFINGVKTACSNSWVVQVNTPPLNLVWGVDPDAGTISANFQGSYLFNYQIACYIGGTPSSCTVNENVNGGSVSEGQDAEMGAMLALGDASYICYLRIFNSDTGAFIECTDPYPVTILPTAP